MDKKQLTKKLEELELGLADIFEDVPAIQEVLDGSVFDITIECVRGEAESFMFVHYFSEQLGKSVVLAWDLPAQYDSAEELAEVLLGYESEAEELEGRVPNISEDIVARLD